MQSGPIFSSGMSLDHSRGIHTTPVLPGKRDPGDGPTGQPNLAYMDLPRTESQPNWDKVPQGSQPELPGPSAAALDWCRHWRSCLSADGEPRIRGQIGPQPPANWY